VLPCGVKVMARVYQRPSGLPHCSLSLAARGRPAGGSPGTATAPLRRRPHSVRWRPPLRWSWFFSWDRHRPAGLTLPAGPLRCRSAPAVRQVNRPGWFLPKTPASRVMPKAHISKTASPWERRSPARRVRRERGPCRPLGATKGRGSGQSGDASAEPMGPQRPERPEGASH